MGCTLTRGRTRGASPGGRAGGGGSSGVLHRRVWVREGGGPDGAARGYGAADHQRRQGRHESPRHLHPSHRAPAMVHLYRQSVQMRRRRGRSCLSPAAGPRPPSAMIVSCCLSSGHGASPLAPLGPPSGPCWTLRRSDCRRPARRPRSSRLTRMLSGGVPGCGPPYGGPGHCPHLPPPACPHPGVWAGWGPADDPRPARSLVHLPPRYPYLRHTGVPPPLAPPRSPSLLPTSVHH